MESVHNFAYQGKDYKVILLPENKKYFAVLEVLNNETGLKEGFGIISYEPKRFGDDSEIIIRAQKFIIDPNGNPIPETIQKGGSYSRGEDFFDLFFDVPLNGESLSHLLINGLVFNELSVMAFLDDGTPMQPISISATFDPVSNEITATVIDKDDSQSIEYSFDGGETWGDNNVESITESGDYKVLARYAGVEVRPGVSYQSASVDVEAELPEPDEEESE